jgi:methionyl aminopeptidase
MIVNKEKEEKIVRESANISVDILKQLGETIKEGVTPLQIDHKANILCKSYNVKPAFRRVKGYNYNTCISVNDVTVHGVPRDIPLKKGDLVSIDFGIVHKGYYTDHCWTWSLGEPTEKNKKLIDAGREAVENAVSCAIVGKRTGDLGYEMENTALRNGYNVLKMFVGHGIGRNLYDNPEVPAYGEKGKGDLLVEGMLLCIECQVVDDIDDFVIDEEDRWSVRTVNGGNSVMFEYMVIVGKKEPIILTDMTNWSTVA